MKIDCGLKPGQLIRLINIEKAGILIDWIALVIFRSSEKKDMAFTRKVNTAKAPAVDPSNTRNSQVR